ncbi:sensor domain-containing diguanylate cyclase [Paraburkholderia sp. BL10I2N1]|uniref:sensor domain-containing diguanylate cyclase n=1 Tax=Paraburkholderia sp. BL10I2N1 TaxID=1938796 RepID=UPI00105FF3EE|nr:sensor domain-containing diguanylate cyclase [Paraburkholderia sp. BL10I2N1]TDN61633.1 diguanylate cyclase [Paraburkholderia sp. BL10I2N1]
MDSLLIGRATLKQVVFAGACAMLGLLTLAVAAPRAQQTLPAIMPFMPMCALTVFTTSGIAAFLLSARFTATQQPMLGALGGAYAFTAITVALQLLMFPGVFTRTGLFGAGPYSAAWMWVFWHAGFPLLVILAALLRDRFPSRPIDLPHGDLWRWALIGVPVALAVALGVLAIHANLAEPFHMAPETDVLSGRRTVLVICSLNVVAIVVVLFKGRLRTVLDLWVAIAVLTSFVDASLNLLSMVPFTVGWYVARIFSMLAPGVLVCVLVWEVTVLYRQLSEAHASLLQSSTRDALTLVYNRSYFNDQFPREFDRSTRNGQPLSLIMVDVDNFKHYNDAFGHLRGDACLSAIASALAGTARRPGDFVARYGGEEFALVLPDTGADEASDIAEQARLAVMHLGLPAPVPAGQITISAGCATSQRNMPATPSGLVQAADAALYDAKRAGRNRVGSVTPAR